VARDGDRSILDEVRRSFRTLLLALALSIGAIVVVVALLVGVLLPALDHDVRLVTTARELHVAMVEREASLRALLNGEPSAEVEGRARGARDQAAQRLDELMTMLGEDVETDHRIVATVLAARTWEETWATPSERSIKAGTVADLPGGHIGDGQHRFVDYRSAHRDLLTTAQEQRAAALDMLGVSLASLLGATLVLGSAFGAVLWRQRRRLHGQLSGPFAAVDVALDALRAGEPVPADAVEGPRELRAIGAGLATASETLRADRAALVEQQRRTEASASTLAAVLDVAREIAGSLNVRYVAESLAEAAPRVAPVVRVRAWTADEGALTVLHDSSLPHGVAPPPIVQRIGHGVVGGVARDARSIAFRLDEGFDPLEPTDAMHEAPERAGRLPDGADGWVFPLVVGGRVVGALEVHRGSDTLTEESIVGLETLAIHGAAALEAARLHRAAEDLAHVDALTQLANRRRLDEDLRTELERARRYGRPLGLIMLDIDHFKVLNDTYGHQHGDEVLRLLAATLTATLRGSDTAYRYGGEELCIVVRESDAGQTRELAERLRAELAHVFVGDAGFARVTASFGVAATPDHADTPAGLLAAADRALYAAKGNGRDRVEVADTDAGARDADVAGTTATAV
jgi:diguanylate cyclase (GGDEF)-like protein